MKHKTRFFQVKRRILLMVLGGSCLSLAAAFLVIGQMDDSRPAVAQVDLLPTIVIDAGHGGMDGGAVGVHKELEKDINLSISKTLKEMLQAGGYQTVMVREDDVSIHDPQFTSVRQQKVSDIKNRLKIAEETPNAIYLSIHLNHFEKSQYHGAQMFYSRNNPESEALATVLREQFRALLQPENEREIKPAEKNLYILSHTTCPAVLVECGFLSNPDESALLSDPEYQQKVAFTIYTALMKYQEAGVPAA